MPFCPSCGRELIPGNKYCTECGAPVNEQGSPEPQSPSPVPIPQVPQGERKRPVLFFVLIGIIVLCIIVSAVYFGGLIPGGLKSSSAKPPATPQITPVPTSPVVSSPPPVPETTVIPATTVTSRIVDSDRFGSDYELAYSIHQNFSFGQKVSVTQNVTVPPLYIRFSLIPVNVSRHRLVGIGTHQEHYENTTEVSPNAWFEVKVFDLTDDHLVDQQGFSRDYSDVTTQEFMVRQKGNYRIEMAGHEVNAAVSIMKGIAG